MLGWTALAGLAALLVFALPASAEYYEGKPECPEGQACTLSAPSDEGNSTGGQAFGPEDCIECSQGPTRGPADCEYCRGDDGNVSDPDQPTYNGDCGGEVCAYDGGQTGSGTCMDGADPREICDRDVQYLDGGNGQPIESHQPAEQQGAGGKAVPALGLAGLAIAGVAGTVLVAARRKR